MSSKHYVNHRMLYWFPFSSSMLSNNQTVQQLQHTYFDKKFVHCTGCVLLVQRAGPWLSKCHILSLCFLWFYQYTKYWIPQLCLSQQQWAFELPRWYDNMCIYLAGVMQYLPKRSLTRRVENLRLGFTPKTCGGRKDKKLLTNRNTCQLIF